MRTCLSGSMLGTERIHTSLADASKRLCLTQGFAGRARFMTARRRGRRQLQKIFRQRGVRELLHGHVVHGRIVQTSSHIAIAALKR